MSDEQALLKAIIAEPDEDTPRLAYADWLDEHATTNAKRVRAEFIRLACERARTEDEVGRAAAARRLEMNARLQVLEKQQKAEWSQVLRGKKGPLRGRDALFHFRRGFPHCAFAPVERFVEDGDALFRLAPITELNVRGVTPENVGPLLACPWLRNVRELNLSGPYSGEAPGPDWGALADSPHLGNLTTLWLSRGRLDRGAGARIAAANPFPQLERLMCSDLDLSSSGIDGLFGGPSFGRLTEIYFHRCEIDAAMIERLGRAEALSGLTKLSLPNQPLPAKAMRALTAARFWPSLRELVLWHCDLDDDAIAVLTAVPPEALRVLDISMNRFGPVALATLAESRILAACEVLNLGSNPVWDAGVLALVRSPHLGKLVRLHLGGSGLGPEAAQALAGCPSLAGLSWLTLHSNPLGATGFLALADSPYLGELEYLSLSNVRGKARARLKERFGDHLRL